MDIPQNNTPELAQWYLERGWDQKTNFWFWVLLLPVPPLALIALPFCIGELIGGRKKIQIGREMNRVAGRTNNARPRGLQTSRFMKGYDHGPGTRFSDASVHPPITH